MKVLLLLATCVLGASSALAQAGFPGLKSVLTAAEWQRAGLDRLSPDQIGVIDAALIGHYRATISGAAATPPLPTSAAAPAAANAAAPATTSAESPAVKKRLWERFGLPKGGDWRNQPPLVVKVIGWQSPSRFVLENGQVWEGLEQIPYELADREVIIEARPNDAYALKLNERSAVVRVRRVK